MAIDYKQSAVEIIALLGGSENVLNVSHCATRLRFILKNNQLVDKERISRVKGVITVVEASGQMQVVIGNHVGDIYQHVLNTLPTDSNVVTSKPPKIGIVNRVIDIISSIFAPFLYPLAACGILQGMISLLAAIGWMDRASGTYRILDFISWSGFTFLPVLVAITAAKKFNVNPFSAVISACALISPSYMSMMSLLIRQIQQYRPLCKVRSRIQIFQTH